MDFDPKSMKESIDRVKAIPNSHYVEQVRPYAESLHPNDKVAQANFLAKALQRKIDLQKDFEKLVTKSYEKREGTKGTFTFEQGWQPGGAAPKAEKEEKTHPLLAYEQKVKAEKAAKEKAAKEKVAPAPHPESPATEASAHADGDIEKLPDVPEEKLKEFFAEKAGEVPPHRKWYWKKWAEASMNKAKIPKEEQEAVWKKVLAQGKVMLAKKTIAGQKVSQAQHEAYIKAQAAKKGATPELMPVVKEKPKAEKPASAAPAGPPKEKGPGPEHPYQYYWKTWANQAAKETGGKAASSDVHEKISGLAKKFVAEKQAAGVKFTGKDLEKFIKAAAKKGGDHPGEI
jgi:cytochrome c5